MKVLSFGEILWDVYPDEKHIGGAPLNFAAHLSKHGAEVYMLSALGKDALGVEAQAKLKERDILDEYVSFLEDKTTGKCLVSLDENAVPSYNLLQNVAYDYIDCKKVKGTFDVLYFGTLALRSEYNYHALQELLQNNDFANVFVDVNIRPPFYSKEAVLFSIQNATILKISLEELPIISELLEINQFEDYKAFAKQLAETFDHLNCIIITLGSDGAYVFECKKCAEYACAGKKVQVASTVGAGDSFSAAFLYQYLQKNDIKFCLEYATKVAGFVVSKYAAVPDYNKNDFI